MYQRRSGRIRRRHISSECGLEPGVRYRIWIELNDGIHSGTLLVHRENARDIELR
jgi:hypothetical protein